LSTAAVTVTEDRLVAGRGPLCGRRERFVYNRVGVQIFRLVATRDTDAATSDATPRKILLPQGAILVQINVENLDRGSLLFLPALL
jgi:hypothetical protein